MPMLGVPKKRKLLSKFPLDFFGAVALQIIELS